MYVVGPLEVAGQGDDQTMKVFRKGDVAHLL